MNEAVALSCKAKRDSLVHALYQPSTAFVNSSDTGFE